MLDAGTRARGGIESVMVVGLGYAGLPLAVAFAEAGLAVVGLEKSAEKVAALRGGESHVEDVRRSTCGPYWIGAALPSPTTTRPSVRPTRC